MSSRARLAVASLGVLLLMAATSSAASAASGCLTGLASYASTGAEQCYTVPTGVSTVHVVAVGGRGGDGNAPFRGDPPPPFAPGGFGAQITSDIAVTGGQTLYVEVAGNGAAGGTAGYNGGGSSQGFADFPPSSGGGGGGSDVRTTSCDTSCPGPTGSLQSRLLVAGGGGGGGFDASGNGDPFNGGAGGVPAPGGDGMPMGQGGVGGGGATGAAGGTGGGGADSAAGALGTGGSDLFGGGGGGGLYGGGAGGSNEGGSGGGGGGSSSGPAGSTYALDTTGTPRVTISAPPVATTNPASDVTPATATLKGTVDPDGQAANYHFEYGTSTAYGQSTPNAPAGSDDSNHPESAGVSGLQPLTTYHFRIVASSPGGTSVGADQIFTTTGLAPTALTTEAGDVTETTARITGTVNPRGLDTTYRFDYGTTTAYGATTATQSSRLTASASTPSQNAGAGTTDERVSAPLSGLSPGTTYHYRVVAMNAAGTTSGGDRIFTTPAPPPPAKPPAPTPPPAKPPALAIGPLPSGCAPATLVARVRVTSSSPLRSVRLLLDDRLLATSTKSVFSVRIVTRRLGAGRHRLKVAARNASSQASTRSALFRVCPARARHRAPARPRFTG